MTRAARQHDKTRKGASREPDTNRLSSSASNSTNGEFNVGTRDTHSAIHNRVPMLRPFVSRETYHRPLSHSIPAHTTSAS